MAKRKDIFPSKYLKASDLAGKPLVVEIERAPTETFGSGNDAVQKTVVCFRGGPKPLPLNMTNWDAIAAIGGDDTNDWPGHRVELYPSTTTLRGSTVDCIRIRALKAAADLNDKIPF